MQCVFPRVDTIALLLIVRMCYVIKKRLFDEQRIDVFIQITLQESRETTFSFDSHKVEEIKGIIR